jgi:hypothetical protein
MFSPVHATLRLLSGWIHPALVHSRRIVLRYP